MKTQELDHQAYAIREARRLIKLLDTTFDHQQTERSADLQYAAVKMQDRLNYYIDAMTPDNAEMVTKEAEKMFEKYTEGEEPKLYLSSTALVLKLQEMHHAISKFYADLETIDDELELFFAKEKSHLGGTDDDQLKMNIYPLHILFCLGLGSQAVEHRLRPIMEKHKPRLEEFCDLVLGDKEKEDPENE